MGDLREAALTGVKDPNQATGHNPCAATAPGHTDLMISPEAIDEALAEADTMGTDTPPYPCRRPCPAFPMCGCDWFR